MIELDGPIYNERADAHDSLGAGLNFWKQRAIQGAAGRSCQRQWGGPQVPEFEMVPNIFLQVLKSHDF